jgi:hypothetical protein
MSSSLLPPLIVKYKPAGAEQRPVWKYEHLDADGIEVHYRPGRPAIRPSELEVDLGNIYITLCALDVADVRVSTEADGRVALQLDPTTGPGDRIRLRIPPAAAKRLAEALTTALRRSEQH